jgi:hypothetical protein
MKNNNPYISGIADCWYSGAKGDMWVEYKFIAIPARDTTMINLIDGKTPIMSRLQQKWLRERHAENRNVAVIVGSSEGGIVLTNRSWEHPMLTESFRSKLLTRKELAAFIERRCI